MTILAKAGDNEENQSYLFEGGATYLIPHNIPCANLRPVPSQTIIRHPQYIHLLANTNTSALP